MKVFTKKEQFLVSRFIKAICTRAFIRAAYKAYDKGRDQFKFNNEVYFFVSFRNVRSVQIYRDDGLGQNEFICYL